ncbi:MAG: YggU family protein [Nitrospira sp.]|nr:YggU family protein [Nitrospira sp.]
MVRDGKDGVILTVHVQPNASKTECVGVHGDALKIRLTARPVDGAANDELIRFIAEQCAVPRAHVQIQAGAEARRKRLCIRGITAQVLLTRLMPQHGKEKERI